MNSFQLHKQEGYPGFERKLNEAKINLHYRKRVKVFKAYQEDVRKKLIHSHIYSHKIVKELTLWERFNQSVSSLVNYSARMISLKNLKSKLKLLKSLWLNKVKTFKQFHDIVASVEYLGSIDYFKKTGKYFRLLYSPLDLVTADLSDRLQEHEKLKCLSCGSPLGKFYSRDYPYLHWLCTLPTDNEGVML